MAPLILFSGGEDITLPTLPTPLRRNAGNQSGAAAGDDDSSELTGKDDPGVTKTTFHINFNSEKLQNGEYATKIKSEESAITTFRSVCTNRVENTMKDKSAIDIIKSGEITKESYYAAAMDAALREQPCLAFSANTSRKRSFKCSYEELHDNILSMVLEGLPLPNAIRVPLHAFLQGIGEVIKKSDAKDRQIFLVWLTVFQFDAPTKSVKTIIRSVRFQTNLETHKLVSGKGGRNVKEVVEFSMDFVGSQWDFVKSIWDKIEEKSVADMMETYRETQSNLLVVNYDT